MGNNKEEFLRYLYQQNAEVFTLAEVAPYFKELKKSDYAFINHLEKVGWLTKLKNGLYARNPIPDPTRPHIPNWHKVVASLVYPNEYYIGFYSALQIHNLITQPALREYFVTKQRIQPKVQIIQGIPFEAVYCKPERFFGFKQTWINNYDKVYCSNLEKTIIDCLYQPQYAGGVEGIVKAIYKAREKIRPNVLLEYAVTFKVQAVIKRLGFVLDNLRLFPVEQNTLRQLITASYTPLDPSLKIKGGFQAKWKIEDNVGIEEMIKTIYT